ncbi:hypothetical protein ACTZWT_21055 [Rhodopseudomonas sp. NSM]|uniref:hypothetical protein n=1 Tax=Rhodopseudomonas sp. NSM TaxID=3457630 RepID=UPI004035F507
MLPSIEPESNRAVAGPHGKSPRCIARQQTAHAVIESCERVHHIDGGIRAGQHADQFTAARRPREALENFLRSKSNIAR